VQNPPRDERTLQRRLADFGRRLRSLETLPRSQTMTAYTADHAATAADGTMLVSAAAGPVTITLPDATAVIGKAFTIKRTDTTYTNSITVATVLSQTIDGAATYTALYVQYAYVTVQSDGTNWQVTGVSLPGPWISFSTTWSGSLGAPAIGNGSIQSTYMRAGKWVSFRINLTWGSTTTAGSGAYGFTLPVAPIADQACAAVVVDSNVSTRYACTGWLTNGAGVFRILTGGGAAGISGTVPMTFATSDQIIVSGTYETV
jgi:hypothetical protein